MHLEHLKDPAPTSVNPSVPDGLRYSERRLWDRAVADNDSAVLAVLERLARLRAHLRVVFRCRTCKGKGSVSGFWFGTLKTCPACHGRGER